MYFPVFYLTKEFVTSDSPSVSRCLSQYRANMWEDLTALWKVAAARRASSPLRSPALHRSARERIARSRDERPAAAPTARARLFVAASDDLV